MKTIALEVNEAKDTFRMYVFSRVGGFHVADIAEADDLSTLNWVFDVQHSDAEGVERVGADVAKPDCLSVFELAETLISEGAF